MQNILVQTNMKNIFIFDISKIFHIRNIAYEKDFQNFVNENYFQQLMKKFLNYFLKIVPIYFLRIFFILEILHMKIVSKTRDINSYLFEYRFQQGCGRAHKNILPKIGRFRVCRTLKIGPIWPSERLKGLSGTTTLLGRC